MATGELAPLLFSTQTMYIPYGRSAGIVAVSRVALAFHSFACRSTVPAGVYAEIQTTVSEPSSTPVLALKAAPVSVKLSSGITESFHTEITGAPETTEAPVNCGAKTSPGAAVGTDA